MSFIGWLRAHAHSPFQARKQPEQRGATQNLQCANCFCRLHLAAHSVGAQSVTKGQWRLYSRQVTIMLSLAAWMKEGSDKYSRSPNKPVIERPDAVKEKIDRNLWTWQCLIKSGLIGKTRWAPVEQCQRQTHSGREGLIGKTKCSTCGTSEGDAGLGPN